MLSEIGCSDGAMHKFKNGTEIGLPDGVMHKIRLIEMGYPDGANHVVWRAIDCQAHNYTGSGSGWGVSGGIAVDGSIYSSVYGAKGTWHSIFQLLFDDPLDSTLTLIIHGIYIDPNNNPPSECWLEVDGVDASGTSTVIGQNFIPPPVTSGDLTFSSSGKQYTKLNFLVNANAINGFNAIALAGCITVNGHQINQVELI